LPAGVYSGLLKLRDSPKGSVYTNLRRDSEWSDDKTDPSRERYYFKAPNPEELDPPPPPLQPDSALKGAWRTPSLRDVAVTAPYMHDGYYKTLEDVVWHYNVGGTTGGSEFVVNVCDPGVHADADAGIYCSEPDAGVPVRAVQIKPLGLTDGEVADIVEFLKTLTGAPITNPFGTDDGDWAAKPALPSAATSDAGTPDSATPDGGASDGSTTSDAATLADGGSQ
jgi:hypothetical protein